MASRRLTYDQIHGMPLQTFFSGRHGVDDRAVLYDGQVVPNPGASCQGCDSERALATTLVAVSGKMVRRRKIATGHLLSSNVLFFHVEVLEGLFRSVARPWPIALPQDTVQAFERLRGCLIQRSAAPLPEFCEMQEDVDVHSGPQGLGLFLGVCFVAETILEALVEVVVQVVQ